MTSYSSLLATLEAQLKTVTGNPAQEARLILSAALGIKPHETYLLPLNSSCPLAVETKVRQMVERRRRNEPIDYILGYREFRGANILVNSQVLIPRPETEQLVEIALDSSSLSLPSPSILEVGTGSGCISVTLLKGLSEKAISTYYYHGIDISSAAVEVTHQNLAANLGLKFIKTTQGYHFTDGARTIVLSLADIHSLPAEMKHPFTVLISNPPYLTSREYADLEPSVKDFEPKQALEAGIDGLDIYRGIGDYCSTMERKPALFLEVSPVVAGDARALFAPMYSKIEILKDIFGKDRFLRAN